MKRILPLGFLLVGLSAWTLTAVSDRPLKMVLPDSTFPFHPHEAETSVANQVFTGVFEGLVSLDPQTLAPVPAMAESWSLSDNGRILTLTLRPGLVWSDGSPITTNDVLLSWKEYLNPNLQRTFATLFDEVVNAAAFRTGRLGDFSQVGVSVGRGNQIVIRLVRPSPHFISILAHFSFFPVHSSLRGRSNTAPERTIANGPYTVGSFIGSRLVLVKNPRYWDAANVAIPRIEITFSGDSEAMTRAYSRGEVDWINADFDPKLVLNREHIVVSASYSSSYLYFNSSRPGLRDERVRRALTLLLDHNRLREEQVLGSAALVPPIPPYPLAQGITQTDQVEAERLLAEAGFPLGRGLPPLRVVLPGVGDYMQRLFKILEDAWKEYATVSLELVPWNDYYARTKTDTFDVAFQSWIGDFPDPLTFLLMWETGSTFNTARLSDPEFDRLLEESRTMQQTVERFRVLSRAENRLLQSGAVIPLGFGISVHLIDRQSIGGWFPNPLDFHPFKRLFFIGRRALPNLAMGGVPVASKVKHDKLDSVPHK